MHYVAAASALVIVYVYEFDQRTVAQAALAALIGITLSGVL